MPGILPMKVIKVGSTSQSRVAQACDRCRSKKIRCDGIRPCCSQCASVGFECKTSDKLSRRAFPRGYTESLEERVRSLEGEIRELKDLLDERDEKIDVLSRVYSQSQSAQAEAGISSSSSSSQMPPPQRPPSSTGSSRVNVSDSASRGKSLSPSKILTPQGRDAPFFQDPGLCDSHLEGTSSSRHLLDSLVSKAETRGKSCPALHSETLRNSTIRQRPRAPAAPSYDFSQLPLPPRMVADQLINIYFQEWSPLFPILHRTSFLTVYERYCTSPADIDDLAFFAQLYLIFDIASTDNGFPEQYDIAIFEPRWRNALSSVVEEMSLQTLQCLALAQLRGIVKGDRSGLLHYKSVSMGLALFLGLDQSQENVQEDQMTRELRKRNFWTLYTLDSFSSALFGVPRTISWRETRCEIPADIDDEMLSNAGSPMSPGDGSTQLSGALALIGAAQILSRVLDSLYGPNIDYSDTTGREAKALENELNRWNNGLPQHLKLHFAQDKPSTRVISSRCPILSFVHHYIQFLIHRPAACMATGNMATSSIISMATSSKRMIQIVELLDERGLSFSICLERNEVLLNAGLGLLCQSLELPHEPKLTKDGQCLLWMVVELLEKNDAMTTLAFKDAVASLTATTRPDTLKGRSQSDGNIGSTNPQSKKRAGNVQTLATRMARTGRTSMDDKNRRVTFPSIHTSTNNEVGNISGSSYVGSPVSASSVSTPSFYPPPTMLDQSGQQPSKQMNLDYLPLNAQSTPNLTGKPGQMNPNISSDEWRQLLGNIDNGQTNIYDNIYGGRPVDALVGSSQPNNYHDANSHDWNASGPPVAQVQQLVSQSEDGLPGGGSFTSSEMNTCRPVAAPSYQALPLPDNLTGGGFGLELLDNNFDM